MGTINRELQKLGPQIQNDSARLERLAIRLFFTAERYLHIGPELPHHAQILLLSPHLQCARVLKFRNLRTPELQPNDVHLWRPSIVQ